MEAMEKQEIENQEWITKAEAARMCNVSPQTVKRWVDGGLLDARMLPGGRIQIEKSSLARVITPLG
jgi:excisionase family DNA binding protein